VTSPAGLGWAARRCTSAWALVLVLLVCPTPGAAQVAAPPVVAPLLTTALATGQAPSAPAGPTATPPQVVADAPPPAPGALASFFVDVGRDYRAWFTLDTTRTLMVGTAAAMSIHPFDEKITERGFNELGDSLGAGQQYGNASLQFPLAVGWWAIGHLAGSRQAADTGRDLLRAQISAASFTYVLKFAVGRTRPNGDSRSFPSGHASATFATATVLQRHYGWKVGLPFYALGVYTAASRIQDKKHWVSDTVMGATIGVAAGRAVTFRLKDRPVHVVPVKVAGGAMIQFVVDP
jgi:membrane-associated phospholipid phosphatase